LAVAVVVLVAVLVAAAVTKTFLVMVLLDKEIGAEQQQAAMVGAVLAGEAERGLSVETVLGTILMKPSSLDKAATEASVFHLAYRDKHCFMQGAVVALVTQVALGQAVLEVVAAVVKALPAALLAQRIQAAEEAAIHKQAAPAS
jgi:hypothetical protein